MSYDDFVKEICAISGQTIPPKTSWRAFAKSNNEKPTDPIEYMRAVLAFQQRMFGDAEAVKGTLITELKHTS